MIVRSSPHNGGSAGLTRTSLGPAGMSIEVPTDESIEMLILAAVTYWFPGPKILSTLGTVSVPYAIAAIPWAPPALTMVATPDSEAM